MDKVFGPNEYNTHKPAQPINWNSVVFNGFVALVTLTLIACVQLFVDNPLLKFVMIAMIVLLSFTTIRRGPLTEVDKDDNE